VAGSAGAGSRARVVIVGAGFGGLACARKLNRLGMEVLLLDRHGYHLFAPLLYQVATALLTPSDICYPLRTIFRRSPNVRARQATVETVDLARQVVHLHSGEAVPYDYLVLATGSVDNHFGNDELARASIGLKNLEDATRLRNRVLACLERADGKGDPEERRALLTFVVVGGGPTGVEYAGALGELLKLVAGRDFPGVRLEDTHILLVEGQDRLLGAFSDRIGRYAERVLTKRGVDVRTKTLVRTADDRSVMLSDGTVVPARTVVWTAGVWPLLPHSEPRLETNRRGRVRVDEFLRLRGAPRVYVLGDAAGAEQDGEELPMVSAPAMQAGRYVARAIHADVTGRQPGRPFRYVDKGSMATIGRNAAVAHLGGGLELTGAVGWLAWLFVHVWYLEGFRNRLVAISHWAWNYVRFDRPNRIILETARDPMVATLAAPGGRAAGDRLIALSLVETRRLGFARQRSPRADDGSGSGRAARTGAAARHAAIDDESGDARPGFVSALVSSPPSRLDGGATHACEGFVQHPPAASPGGRRPGTTVDIRWRPTVDGGWSWCQEVSHRGATLRSRPLDRRPLEAAKDSTDRCSTPIPRSAPSGAPTAICLSRT
jgi:NADH dehydrogenase